MPWKNELAPLELKTVDQEGPSSTSDASDQLNLQIFPEEEDEIFKFSKVRMYSVDQHSGPFCYAE